MHVQIVLFDGFDPIDVLGPYEVFHTGGLFTGGAVTVELTSAEGPRTVPSGLPAISLTASVEPDVRAADVVVVPGAAGRVTPGPDGEPTLWELLERAAATGLTALMRDALATPDTILATVCGGSILVARAGLADGRPLVTHDRGADLAGTDAVPVTARVVDDGDLVSSGNVTSGIDMALYLLDRGVGPRVAHAAE
jgi:putative intracellular protease/amidase